MENLQKPISEIEKYFNIRKSLDMATIIRIKKEEDKINAKIHTSSDYIPLPQCY